MKMLTQDKLHVSKSQKEEGEKPDKRSGRSAGERLGRGVVDFILLAREAVGRYFGGGFFGSRN